MTEPVFLRVVALSGVPRNKVRAFLCRRPVSTWVRLRIADALRLVGAQYRAAHRERRAA